MTRPIYASVDFCVLVAQLCLTLCDPMDFNLPGSPIHGILQARILEWVTIPFSRGSSQPRDWTQASRMAGRFFTVWATRKSWLICKMGIKRVTQTPQNHCNDLTADMIYCTQITCKAMTRYISDLGRWRWGKGSQGELVNLAPSYPVEVFPPPNSMAVSVCMRMYVRGRNIMHT